ncbi:MAG: F0F1 ATP synthase subunit B [Gemmatimonadota bacterium]|nr:MAG: F0F1 ATP synthase subunit B [Gemmatimonadota bacterium]
MSKRSKNRRRPGAAARHLCALAAALGLSLVTAIPLLAQEEHGGSGGGLFDINWPGLMFWTWLIFLLLLFVLRKWAWGPILGALESREKRIQETLDGAARDREEANRLLDEHRRILDESRDQAQSILADNRKAAEALRAEMLDAARSQKDQIVASAREDIERERDEALDALRREAVDLSISAAGRVLHKELDSEENRRIVEEYLEGLVSDEKGGEAG